MNIFNVLLYQPLLNALILIYNYIPGHDFGLAVIALTILIRLLLYPLTAESIRVQKITADIQPKIKEIQIKHKNDREKQAVLTMQLWKEHKINPFSGFLLILIQLPILIALYQVFYKGITNDSLNMLYSFVPNPGLIKLNFLGLVNLESANLFIAILAGVMQYFQTKTTTFNANIKNTKGKLSVDQMEQFSRTMNSYMLYVFPLITVFILWKLPAALGLYWVISSLFSIIQQYFILKRLGSVAA